MAYIDARNRWNRPGPITAVVAIHAAIGYLVVTGLTATVLTPIEDRFGSIEFPTKPPKTEIPPPNNTADPVDRQVVAPKPEFDFNQSVDIDVKEDVLPPIGDLVLPIRPTGTPGPKPSPLFDPVAPRPRTSPSSWITTDDYPSRAIREGAQGTASFRLEIAPNGTVQGCTITKSSGSDQLDAATCRYVQRRARFDPARDSSGNPVSGRYSSSVQWVLPE